MSDHERSREELPAGLGICVTCGAVRGKTRGRTSTCFCEGMVCEGCGKRRRRRPISDYYDPEDGQWWHVPWFMGHARKCRGCR